MRRFAGSKTNTLLQKASVQLSGGRVSATSTAGQADDDDGLGDYLKSLGKKPAKTELQWDRFGELSDLSAETDDEHKNAKQSAVETKAVASNKFIKKKSDPQPTAASQTPSQSAHTTHGPSGRPSALGNVKAQSAALGKAQSFVARYSASAVSKAAKVSSESDLDVSFSPDEDVLADVRATKASATSQPSSATTKPASVASGQPHPCKPVTTNQSVINNKPVTSNQSVASQKPGSFGFHARAPPVVSDDDESKSLSVGVGKAGTKFIKKSVAPAMSDTAAQLQKHNLTSSSSSSAVAATGAARITQQGHGSGSRSQPAGHSRQLDKSSITPAAHRPSTSGHRGLQVLTSDDESLAEFMGQLSSPHSQRAGVSGTRGLSSSVEEPVEESVSEAESDHFHFNVRGVEALESDTESSLGHRHLALHTVDELLYQSNRSTAGKAPLDQPDNGARVFDVDRQPQYDSDFESVQSSASRGTSPAVVPPLRSILSITPRSVTPKSSRSRVRLNVSRSRSPSPVSTARSRSNDEDVEEVGALSTGRSVEPVQTDSSGEDEVSTGGGDDVTAVSASSLVRYRSGRRSSEPLSVSSAGQRSRSWQRRRASDTAMTYSEDFTACDTETSHKTYDTDRSHDRSRKSDVMTSSTRHQRRQHPRREARDVRDTGVQTGIDVNLCYSWPKGTSEAVADAQYGLAFVNPPSIATTVVSADALEAVTAYNPSVIATNDLLRQQLHLTRQLLAIQSRLKHDLVSSLHATQSYHYTTLHDTKQYIKRHRRRVPTFDEALKQVQQEMMLTSP